MLSYLLVLVATAGGGMPTAGDELTAGVKLEADGEAIDVEVGHAAPAYVDFDGDGMKDLLVGQFGGGKLRIYKNHGTNEAPQFEDFEFFQAGGKEATVPFG